MDSQAAEDLAEVKKKLLEIGTPWIGPTADATYAIYKKTYDRLRQKLLAIQPISGVSYGPAARNVMDIYLPIMKPASPPPVVVYLHGGGFFAGDKSWTEENYANIGNYFASKGMICICANYQLVGAGAKYPSGGDDVGHLRKWVHDNISKPENGGGDVNNVVLIGQSSGAAHIATNLYAVGDPAREETPVPLPAGVVYLSAPFSFDHTKARRAETLREYFGSDDPGIWTPFSSVGLVSNLPLGHPSVDSSKLKTLLCVGELETKEITDANILFFNAYRSKSSPLGSLPLMTVVKGHNHISNVLSIGTEDDLQGRILLDFICSTTGGDTQ